MSLYQVLHDAYLEYNDISFRLNPLLTDLETAKLTDFKLKFSDAVIPI